MEIDKMTRESGRPAGPNPKRRKGEKPTNAAPPPSSTAETEADAPKNRIMAQFKSAEGTLAGPQLDLPQDITTEQLQTLINELLSNEEAMPYAFYVEDSEITSSLSQSLQDKNVSSEVVLTITYHPQAVFRVRPVTRCTCSMPGHTEAVLSVNFSPDGKRLASGSGDGTVRVWDVDTETPQFTCQGHKGWVLCIAWSPDCKRIASGSTDGDVRIWCPETGKALGSPLKGHKQYITSLSWEPLHRNGNASRLASAGKDGTIRIWDVLIGRCLISLTSHTLAVTQVKWGGEGLIYSASRDRSIKVWDADSGRLVRELSGHAHWINTLALSNDYVLRTSCFEHGQAKDFANNEERKEAALERYQKHMTGRAERLISGSDDFTMFLWEPSTSKKPIARLTGHQQLINHVNFSPDGRYIASASFDKSVRLWDGLSGKFIATLRGHVGSVYQVCWSADSRLLVSGSKDTTMKVWDIKTRKLKFDLPGHADEVYTVDWSPDGERVASGSKDRLLRIWRH